ncbi:MAG: phosphate acyltransferase, partial [candidate division KSB1 bacterium]|nr:phosphate acyltransferase [candidate division KSB1 bacterium]
MFDIERSLDEQILALQRIKPTAIFADGLDARVILAASRLVRFAKIVIPASEEEIAAFARRECPQLDETRIEYLLSHVKAVDLTREEKLVDEFAREYMRVAEEGWSGTLDEARALLRQPPMFAIMAVKLGYADMAFGGLRYGPREFFRPFMRIVGHHGTAFEAGIFVLPEGHMEQFFEQNIVVFGDVAVNARMSPARLADIAVGTCKIARDLIPQEVLPYINGCIVSYSTKGLDEGPSVDMVRRAAELVPPRLAALVRRDPLYSTIRIDAEVQISCAISREAAVVKLGERYRPDSPLGRVNVIIAPNLDLGNFLYNMYATRYPSAKKFPISGGLENKVVDFSKESTESDVVLGAKANILMLLKSGKWQATPRDSFFPRYRILAINPGSTSTKVAYFEGEIQRYAAEIKHTQEELAPFEEITDQYEFRKQVILSELKANRIDISGLQAVVGRGGLIWPVPSGTFVVNERMKQDLRACVQGSHASNLGGLIAAEIAEELGIPAYIVDPVVVD